jgi:hypothetical protein
MKNPYLPRDYDIEFKETIDGEYDDELQSDVLAALHHWLDLMPESDREYALEKSCEDDAWDARGSVRCCLIHDALSFAGWDLGRYGWEPR